MTTGTPGVIIATIIVVALCAAFLLIDAWLGEG